MSIIEEDTILPADSPTPVAPRPPLLNCVDCEARLAISLSGEAGVPIAEKPEPVAGRALLRSIATTSTAVLALIVELPFRF